MKMGFDNGNRASYAIYHIKGGGGVYSIGCSGIRFSSIYVDTEEDGTTLVERVPSSN